MPVDNCRYSFEDLVDRVLPVHLKRMQEALNKPHPMILLAKSGVGIAGALKTLGLYRDFPGSYVLLDGIPIYVGISRTVVARLIQHVKGKTHYDASLAYRMAASWYPHEMERDAAMNDADFRAHFDKAKAYLGEMSFAYIEIPSAVERCLFEVYCALKYDTGKWNTFETH